MRNLCSLVVAGLRSSMDNKRGRTPIFREDALKPGEIADIEVVMYIIRYATLQVIDIPPRAGFGAEEKGAHIVVDPNNPVERWCEMLHGCTAYEAAAASYENNAHELDGGFDRWSWSEYNTLGHDDAQLVFVLPQPVERITEHLVDIPLWCPASKPAHPCIVRDIQLDIAGPVVAIGANL